MLDGGEYGRWGANKDISPFYDTTEGDQCFIHDLRRTFEAFDTVLEKPSQDEDPPSEGILSVFVTQRKKSSNLFY